MTEPRYRYSGRRSPTSNPARASLPVNVGYNPHFSGDLHAVPTARYDAAAPRRVNEHKASSSSNNPPTTTITTYNVTKEPVPRTSNTARRRSSTVDSGPAGAVKPIIVTTNHATRPHGSSSHTSSAARQISPSRDPYRSSDETSYYALPASSTSRGQRYSHGYSQSATLSNDELRRLRERVGGIDDRLRAPTHTATDYYRYSLPHPSYTAPSHDLNNTAVVDYENEGYEYTKPSDLARYDLDHDRQQPRGRRRESVDRPNYFRPTVNVVSNDPVRYDGPGPGHGRGRGPPPTSSGLDRYNRAATSGIYDRPTVTMPALPPPVPAAPPVDPKRRIEAAPREPSPERRVARPRPVSLYQDAPARMSHPDDLYRSHDDERLLRRRERDDSYLDPEVPARGFGIRTDSLKVEQPDRPARSVDRRDYDDRRVRREAAEREPRRRSDESIDYARPHDTRQSIDDTVSRVDSNRDSRDSRDTVSRKGSLGGRARDKVATGLSVAAAAMGLAPPKETPRDEDRKVSPRRRDTIDEEPEVGSSRTADRYKPRERDVVERAERVERKPSPREDAPVERRESRKERADSTSASRDREVDHDLERERVRERALDRERERERNRDQRELEKERERELEQREREKERDRSHERTRRDTETAPNGSAVVDDRDDRDDSPPSDGATNTSRRRRHNSSTFDPTDTRALLDVKAELAAKDGQEKPKEKSPVGDRTSDKVLSASASSERLSTDSHEESRGREIVTAAQNSEKQVRVVSPPREKSEHKPIKGILKAPSVKFPEEENPIREGVAPHKDDKTKKGVPAGARWTKINRKLINPAALEIGKERFEVRDDFVIVLRVLSKEEIQAYATATAQIRATKRREIEKEMGSSHDYDSRDDDEKRTRRHRRELDDDHEYRQDDNRERHRRHKRDDDSDDDGRGRRAIEYETSSGGRHEAVRHHRPTRDRDYDSITTNSEDRR
ncbi:hypothetical protein F4781DRAFT_208698 [Annulohypoxylon bovei var. microspora]|nr:hypothetical protein F4781DRAFT_208698 [Annulohypoxylon bovei var. microspora]